MLQYTDRHGPLILFIVQLTVTHDSDQIDIYFHFLLCSTFIVTENKNLGIKLAKETNLFVERNVRNATVFP